MRIGLISDTHDNMPLVDVALRHLRQARCDRVFHLGDITAPLVVARMADLPVEFLRGNNDVDPALGESLRAAKLPPLRNLWTGELEGLRVAALHGHHKLQLQKQMGHADVVLHGHTHRHRAEMHGRTLVVNPGALYRVSVRTIAILELPERRVQFYEVREDGVTPFETLP